MKKQGTWNSKSNFRKKKRTKLEDLILNLPDFKTYYKSIISKMK